MVPTLRYYPALADDTIYRGIHLAAPCPPLQGLAHASCYVDLAEFTAAPTINANARTGDLPFVVADIAADKRPNLKMYQELQMVLSQDQ
jgi:hypothetical protein